MIGEVVLQSLLHLQRPHRLHLQRTVVLQSLLHLLQRHANIAHAEARYTKDIHPNVRNCSSDMDAMLVITRIAGLTMKAVHTKNELAPRMPMLTLKADLHTWQARETSTL